MTSKLSRRKQLLVLAGRVTGEFSRDHCTHLAAAISYYVLFSLFPLLIVAVAASGIVLRDEARQDRLVDRVIEHIPLEAEGRGDIATAVREVTGRQAGAIGLVGLAGLLWTASNMFAAIRRSINIAYNVEAFRPLLRQKLVDFGLLLALGPFFLLSIGATALVAFARGAFSGVPFVGEAIADERLTWGLAGFAVSASLSFLAFFVLYWVLPATAVRPRDVWPGALVAALLFEVAKSGFSLYLRNFGNYDVVFGSLGAVVAFLFWVYVSANILLLGAEVASEYPKVRRGDFDAPGGEIDPLRERVWRSLRGLVVGD
ncbi:MAG: YihY/virulence factor BrkB family protein [Dehalococcoidia bacterium]|nr:YihY/virulence factor BrkB family protein [Dehalococcoidia bacterium]